MATITLTIPDVLLPRVVAGMCGRFNYQDKVDDPANPGSHIPNPETKAVFCKRMIRQFVKQSVLQWEAEQAYNTTHNTGEKEVDIT
jgi:hypothetical protein